MWLERVLDDPTLKDLDSAERVELARARQDMSSQNRLFMR